jgi:hypothetical protein
MLRDAAELMRICAEPAMHSDLHLNLKSSSTTNLQGLRFLKVLMIKYYELGPGVAD